jgi:hypothetical protein
MEKQQLCWFPQVINWQFKQQSVAKIMIEAKG